MVLKLMGLLIVSVALIKVVINYAFDAWDYLKNPTLKTNKKFWNLQLKEGTYDHRKKQNISPRRARRWAV